MGGPGVKVHVALGSNRGRRAAYIRRALRGLGGLPDTRVLKASSLFESAPIGATPGSPPFLNAAALIRTPLEPLALLFWLKRIEAGLGRKPGPRGGPRPIDLDIVCWGRRRFRSPWLFVPHPRALARRFVLEPLAEIDPGLKIPGARGRTAAELLRRRSIAGQRLRRVSAQ